MSRLRISVPEGTGIGALEDILRDNGVELEWVEPIEDPPVETFLEYIEMRRDNELPGDTVVDRSTGEFLVLERFFSHDRREPNGDLVLIYGVHHRLTPEEFYQRLGRRASGPCIADDVSDHLVQAFDRGITEDLGFGSVLFAYRAPCGRIMHQHST